MTTPLLFRIQPSYVPQRPLSRSIGHALQARGAHRDGGLEGVSR